MNLEQFYIISVTLIIVAMMISVALAVYSWKRRSRVEVRYFLWFLASVIVWYLAAIMAFISPTPEVAAFWVVKIKFLGVATLPVTFLAFTVSYTGHTDWLKLRTYLLLSIIPATTQIIAWTNTSYFMTDLVFVRYGPYLINVDRITHSWYWVHTAYSYSLLVISFFLLVFFAIQSRYPFRTQAMIIMGGALSALIANVIHVFKVITPSPPEFTALTFGGGGLVWAWALFRYHLLDIMPVAREAVIESMVDAVFVLDLQNRIVDLNPTARALAVTNTSTMIGKTLDEIWPEQQELIESFLGIKETQTEIAVDLGADQRVFDLNISTLHTRRGDETGRLVVLRDITNRVRAEDAIQKQLRAQVALRAAGAVISSSLNTEIVMNRIIEEMGKAIDATSAAINQFEPHSATVTVIAEYNGPEATTDQPSDLYSVYPEIDDPFFWEREKRMRAGQHDVAHWDDADLTEYEREEIQEFGVKSILYIPLMIREDLIGYAEIWESRRRREFSSDEIALCKDLAQQAAVALENARLYEQAQEEITERKKLETKLREQAIHDSLTGLNNRRYFEDQITKLLSKTRRTKEPFSLVMIDIDEFKQINDRFGHSAGDDVLKLLSVILKSDTRQEDIVCRYAGDEFMIVLLGTDRHSAFERADIWRSEFEKQQCDFEGNVISTTLSIGVAQYSDGTQSVDEIVNIVDKALYQSKVAGRNRVTLSETYLRPLE